MNRLAIGKRMAAALRPCGVVGAFTARSFASTASTCDELLVDTTQVPGVALVTFNRPSRLNALSLDMGEAVKQLSKTLPASTRAVVFTGAGRAFSTGRDLKDSKEHTPAQAEEYMWKANDSVMAVKKLRIPTIAALNGHAFGWGLELAFACDIRIAAADATLCFPEASLGIFPGAGGTVLASRVLGPARAKEIIFTSKRFNGTEALAWGAANAVADDGEATVAEAMRMAGRIARMGPLGVQAAKVVIDDGLDLSLEEHMALSNEHRFKLNSTKDFAEALAAFEQKREPNFIGE